MQKNKEGPTLAEIQKMLQEAVISRERVAPAIGEWIEVIVPGPTAAERIAVYGDGWFLRLEESLRDDYPEVANRLGAERWEDLLHHYLRAHPSDSPNIARASDRLPEFLINWDPSLENSEIKDLSRLERAVYKVYAARDCEVWKVDELSSMTDEEAETLRFELQPSVSLHEFSWNAVDLWTGDVGPEQVSQTAVVYRDGFSAAVIEVTAQEFAFLSRIRAAPLLTDLIAEFDSTDWMQWLARFAGDGILCKQKSE